MDIHSGKFRQIDKIDASNKIAIIFALIAEAHTIKWRNLKTIRIRSGFMRHLLS